VHHKLVAAFDQSHILYTLGASKVKRHAKNADHFAEKGLFYFQRSAKSLEHRFIGALGSVDERVARVVSVFARARAASERRLRTLGDCRTAVDGGGSGAAHEQLLERFAELTRHAAVDGEVDRVRDDDEEVGEENEGVGELVVEDLGHAGRDDVQHGDDGDRDLDQQKHGHHHDQHQRGAVGVAQPLALALAVLLEQPLALLLRDPHRPEQHQVQQHQRHARHHMHEDHPATRVEPIQRRYLTK